ncbi:Glycosyltransferase 2-like [Oxalobacteraceae bacterium]
MSASKVTVYITNYNYGRYLRQSVDSVLCQTLQDFELLIIDDGSTDDSNSIMEQYASHPKIKLIYQHNRGLNVTNNIALRLARGQYIVRLDADDHFEPDALQAMSQLLDADPEVGLVFPDYYIVDRSGAPLEAMHRLDFGRDVTLLDQPAHGACTMIRRDFLLALGGYDESYSCQDGYELWIKFISRHKVRNINRPLFHYRQHGENLTTNERRILDTRMSIKRDFVRKNTVVLPRTVGVIPVRDTRLNDAKLAFAELGGRSLLQIKIDALLGATTLDAVVVTSEDPEVANYVEPILRSEPRLLFIPRSKNAARFNASLVQTLFEVLEADSLRDRSIEAVLTAAIEYPNVGSQVIDDAVNTLALFNSDSLISVRPDSSLLYQHHGHGMVPILEQDKFTKLEREALYRAVGGIMLSRTGGLREYGTILHGCVGHVIINRLASQEVRSEIDLIVAQALAQSAAQGMSVS